MKKAPTDLPFTGGAGFKSWGVVTRTTRADASWSEPLQLVILGMAPASPPTVTGFLGGRGGSRCRVTPTPSHFGRFALWLAGGSDPPSPPPPPPRFLLGRGCHRWAPRGPLRSGRWHLFRQRRLGQRSSVLGSLRHHLFFKLSCSD